MMKWILYLTLTISFLSYGQIELDSLTSKYEKKSLIPVEVVHLHIIKSSFVAGEDVSFGAYVLERNSKRPSLLTKNLYVVVEDSNGKRVSEKLFKVDNGFTNGVITLDFKLPVGKYKLRAYTNFMRNEKRPNSFETTIKILDPNQEIESNTIEFIQPVLEFKPESGNLISGIPNRIAITAFDKFRPIEILKGKLLENGELIKEFSTSVSGLGSITFIPKYSAVYEALINWNGIEYSYNLPFVENEGVIISVSQLKDKVIASVKTNSVSLNEFANNTFFLALHDGSHIKVVSLNIEKPTTSIAISHNDISPGVNYVTLFTSDKKPIAERAFFNKKSSSMLTLESKEMKVDYDSLKIKLTLKDDHNQTALDSLSQFTVAAFPLDSKAINPELNLFKKFFVSPYLSGDFQKIQLNRLKEDRKTAYELDILLMALAAPIYNWDAVFQSREQLNYSFEQGLTVNVLSNNRSYRNLMIYPMRYSNAQNVEIDKGEEISFNQVYPQEDEKLAISLINDRGQFVKPQLKYQLFPNVIPPLKNLYDHHDFDVKNIYVDNDEILINTDSEFLEEIVLLADVEEQRADSIRSVANGRVDVFTDQKRLQTASFTNYLNTLPYESFIDQSGRFVVADRSPSRANPVFVLDGILLNDPNILLNLEVSTIDFVEIDNTGVFNGRYFDGDVIKIRTDPRLRNRYDSDVQTIEFPVSFALSQKYTMPVYNSNEDELFLSLGTLGWQAIVNGLHNNQLQFSIPYRGVKQIMIRLEGMTASGKFISEYFQVSSKN